VTSEAKIALALTAITALVAWGLTAIVLRVAMRHRMYDVPSDRSLHSVPTPRGGGLAIALTVLTVIAGTGVLGWFSPPVTIALLGGSVLVAVVGWLDDLRPLSPLLRIAVQSVAVAWFIAWMGGFPILRLSGEPVSFGAAGTILAFLAMLWSINLYNFMDGIDGLAAGQAVVAGALATFTLLPGEPGLGFSTAGITGASLGFLKWNWPPARIFMGDVGSGLLGFLFGALALLSSLSDHGPPLLAWVLFGGVFVFDSTVTLLRRMLRGDRFYQAHREHAYQRLVRSGWSHRRTTVAALVLAAVVGAMGVAATLHPELAIRACFLVFVVLFTAYLFIEKRSPFRRASVES